MESSSRFCCRGFGDVFLGFVTWIFRFLASTTHRWSRSGTMRNLRRRFFTTAPTALRHRRCASSDGCFAATSKFFFKKLSIVSVASLHSLSTRDRSASSSLKPAATWWGAVPVGQAFSFRSSRCGTAKTGTDLSQSNSYLSPRSLSGSCQTKWQFI